MKKLIMIIFIVCLELSLSLAVVYAGEVANQGVLNVTIFSKSKNTCIFRFDRTINKSPQRFGLILALIPVKGVEKVIFSDHWSLEITKEKSATWTDVARNIQQVLESYFQADVRIYKAKTGMIFL